LWQSSFQSLELNSAKEAKQLNSTPTIEVLAGSQMIHIPNGLNSLLEADLRKMAATVEMGYKPLISVIMPVFNPPEQLREAIVRFEAGVPTGSCASLMMLQQSLMLGQYCQSIAQRPRIKVVLELKMGILPASNSSHRDSNR